MVAVPVFTQQPQLVSSLCHLGPSFSQQFNQLFLWACEFCNSLRHQCFVHVAEINLFIDFVQYGLPRKLVDAVDRQMVPATLYTEIQMVFTDVRVEVAAGLIINGVPVVGEVRVELKDTALTVTRPLNLNIGDGESVFLLMDLNANTWLQAVDPVLKVISKEVFGAAVSVGLR